MADYSGDLKYRITVDGAEASYKLSFEARASFKSIASTRIKCCSDGVIPESNEFAGDAISNYENAIQADTPFNATLESTGRAAEFTPARTQKVVSELQAPSNFGDEDILQGATAAASLWCHR